MKHKTLLLLFALFISYSAKSTIYNVDNNPNRPSGYYSSLLLAVNTANNGDTIYIYPSNTTYDNITIDKELHIFGPGYKGITNGAKINNIYLDTNSSNNTNSSGSTIMGLIISNITVYKPNVSNIVISGNNFNYNYNVISMSYNSTGWLITNNFINGYIEANNNGSLIIANNIFNGAQDYPIRNISSSSVIISHNLFLRFQYFYNVFNAIVSDNIFICEGDNSVSKNNHNTYYNNLSWRSTLTPYPIPPEGNTGSGNISNQDPQFETATASGVFDTSKDYHLKSTSPGYNAASDGTNIGPFGGAKPFIWGGSFSIPSITESVITNPVINQSTPLNVNIKGKSADL